MGARLEGAELSQHLEAMRVLAKIEGWQNTIKRMAALTASYDHQSPEWAACIGVWVQIVNDANIVKVHVGYTSRSARTPLLGKTWCAVPVAGVPEARNT